MANRAWPASVQVLSLECVTPVIRSKHDKPAQGKPVCIANEAFGINPALRRADRGWYGNVSMY